MFIISINVSERKLHKTNKYLNPQHKDYRRCSRWPPFRSMQSLVRSIKWLMAWGIGKAQWVSRVQIQHCECLFVCQKIAQASCPFNNSKGGTRGNKIRAVSWPRTVGSTAEHCEFDWDTTCTWRFNLLRCLQLVADGFGSYKDSF